jgi:hypothetical protein
MRALTWDEFAGAAGTAYAVAVGEERIELTLERAEELPSAGRAGGSFRLEFLGPCDPVLPQGIYRMSHGEDEFEIFIVPIARNDDGTRYEAIFY